MDSTCLRKSFPSSDGSFSTDQFACKSMETCNCMVAPLRAPLSEGYFCAFCRPWAKFKAFSPRFFPIISRKHYTEVFTAFLTAVHGCMMRSRGVRKADIEGGRGSENARVNDIALVVELNWPYWPGIGSGHPLF